MQLQAGYILESVRDALNVYGKRSENSGVIRGLLRSLSTFDVETNLNLDLPGNLPSILAVASNILTRGLPTLPSIYIEEYFSKQLSLTQRFDDRGRGKIGFPFISSDLNGEAGELLTKALHIIDPRAKIRSQYLQINDLDSRFERDFLLNLLPDKHA